jgi:hypothetical protein
MHDVGREIDHNLRTLACVLQFWMWKRNIFQDISLRWGGQHKISPHKLAMVF